VMGQLSLIEKREVILLKIAYPDLHSGLAKVAHMYICYQKVNQTKRLLKCQSYKLSNIVGGSGINRYVIEQPNLSRNPFTKTTIIDCDKLFLTKETISRDFLHEGRNNISEELYDSIDAKIRGYNPIRIKLSKDAIAVLNGKG
jgi:hypothetical protein